MYDKVNSMNILKKLNEQNDSNQKTSKYWRNVKITIKNPLIENNNFCFNT